MYGTGLKTTMSGIPRHKILPKAHLISFKSFVLIYFLLQLKEINAGYNVLYYVRSNNSGATNGIECIRSGEFSFKILHMFYLSTSTEGFIK